MFHHVIGDCPMSSKYGWEKFETHCLCPRSQLNERRMMAVQSIPFRLILSPHLICIAHHCMYYQN